VAISGAATSQAATPAAAPYLDPVDLVNDPAGQPVTALYPGALDPAVHSGEEDYQPTTPGGIGSPADVAGGQPFAATLPEQAPGGGYQDTGWLSGHDAPQAVWDSSAGPAFAPSGALDPDVHAEDPGAVRRVEHVIPAAIGSLTRRTQVAQTTVRNGSGDQLAKDNVTSPNGRADLDQYQVHRGSDPGYEPWEIPYAERAILNNLAWEAQQGQASDAQYVPSARLPDRSVFDYAGAAYEAPPDPSLAPALPSADSGIGGGFLLG